MTAAPETGGLWEMVAQKNLQAVQISAIRVERESAFCNLCGGLSSMARPL
ncbi:hypothetical protein HMPREF9123_1698 [Neisseria bacilliformis ATCC BAA-1200]|uniref:Uncharacterized protein n=1 Tax=Neisseria bacilliformis ATCC BAA-1200 TaxID=888742 RepID=F2BD92_9NEIS|nr:hypothetical protein HMPREF9123_1698 [Neisseria bacilliformis ATCC BAA-1200]